MEGEVEDVVKDDMGDMGDGVEGEVEGEVEGGLEDGLEDGEWDKGQHGVGWRPDPVGSHNHLRLDHCGLCSSKLIKQLDPTLYDQGTMRVASDGI